MYMRLIPCTWYSSYVHNQNFLKFYTHPMYINSPYVHNPEIVLRRQLEILSIADFQASRANQLFHQHLELFWRFLYEPVHVLLLLFYKCSPINKRLPFFLVEALKVLFLLLMIHSTKLIWTKMDLIFDLLAIVCVWKCAWWSVYLL